MIVVKKYSNRRLYDTNDSRYITLDDLARTIRAGADVRVVDAKSGEDLTQATLTQIIIESRGAARLLPVPLLVQLIRMGDDALAEFFGRFVSWALEAYLHMKQGARSVSPFNPFAAIPFAASSALARFFSRGGGAWGDAPRDAEPWNRDPEPWREGAEPWSRAAEGPAPYGAAGYGDPEPGPSEEPPPRGADADELAALRRELEELKEAIRGAARDRSDDPSATTRPGSRKPANRKPANRKPPNRKK